MDPDQWRVGTGIVSGLDQVLQGVDGADGEFLVDFDVRLPFVSFEDGPIGHGVEKRPKGRIAAPVVVIVEFDGVDVHGDHLKTTFFNL